MHSLIPRLPQPGNETSKNHTVRQAMSVIKLPMKTLHLKMICMAHLDFIQSTHWNTPFVFLWSAGVPYFMIIPDSLNLLP